MSRFSSLVLFRCFSANCSTVTRRHLATNSTPVVYRDPSKITSVLSQTSVTASLNQQENKIRLLFDDEGEMRYHGVWLRHNCRCSLCYDHSAHNTLVRPNHLEKNNTIIEKVDINGDVVQVLFSNHTALFPVDWLKEHCYTNEEYLKRRHKQAEPLIASCLPVCDYTEMMTTQEGLYKWLKQLVYYGVSLIKNAPTDINTSEKIASKVGFVQESAYGYAFDVRAKDDPDNLAYGFNDLIFHMDLLYHESPPGIQILHCVRNDSCVEGGESTLIDAYPLIKQLQRDHSHYFNVLSTVPVPHMKIDYNRDNRYDIRYATPHIILDNYGEVTGIRWNPPGQYPVKIPEDSVEDYYSAFLHLSKMFDESDLKIVHKLCPGEVLTFNNRRILHGRNSYTHNGGMRHLHGLYVSGDLLRSKFIVLSNELGKAEPVKRIFINTMCE